MGIGKEPRNRNCVFSPFGGRNVHVDPLGALNLLHRESRFLTAVEAPQNSEFVAHAAWQEHQKCLAGGDSKI